MASGFGTVGMGASLAGGLLSAFGANKSGAAEQQMYAYRAQVARINAQINRQNAAFALQKGDFDSVRFGMKAAQQRGDIITTQAASGLDVNSGSAAAVQASQRKLTGMDLATIRENAAREAYNYESKAVMDENQAQLDTMAGDNAREAGELKAWSSILGTVGTVADKWYTGRNKGMWG